MKNNQRDEEIERTDDAPLAAEPESFGTWLRRQREVREIDLREIADSSKVSMSYLQAFEEDRFGVLPSPVFAKGFLRQYARYVGLDPEEVVNFYLAARHPEEDEPSLQARTAPEPPSRNYILIALAVIVALVLLVWLLSVFDERRRSGLDSTTPIQEPPPTAPAPAASAPAAPVSAAPALFGNEGQPAELAVAVPAVEQFPAEKPRSPREQAAEHLLPVRVTLDFMSDCWVEASIDGVKERSELRVQGESLQLSGEEIVEFKIGDVGAVQVEVNGVPFEIEQRRGTSVRNVRIDLETVAALAARGDTQ